MILRCTRRVLDLLSGRAITLTELPPSDDDWYLNLLWLERQKCLLITHAGTLFSVFVAGVRKTDLRPIGPYIVKAVEAELRQRACRTTPSASSIPTPFVSRRRRAAASSAS